MLARRPGARWAVVGLVRILFLRVTRRPRSAAWVEVSGLEPPTSTLRTESVRLCDLGKYTTSQLAGSCEGHQSAPRGIEGKQLSPVESRQRGPGGDRLVHSSRVANIRPRCHQSPRCPIGQMTCATAIVQQPAAQSNPGNVHRPSSVRRASFMSSTKWSSSVGLGSSSGMRWR